MKYLLNLLVFLGLMSCNSSQVSPYSKIEFEEGPCFGFCPIYKITINADRNTILEAEHFNFSEGGDRADYSKPREGTFKSEISKENYQKLIALTNDANVKSLENTYEDKRIMDAAKSYLRIYFSDGSKKEIQISAGEKPEKLTTLYTFIRELKKDQNWEKVK